MASLFELDIKKLKGVGDKKAILLNKLNIFTIGDLITFYPRTYLNYGEIINLCDITPSDNLCSVKGCLKFDVLAYNNGERIISKAKIYDDTGSLKLIFFNNPYIKSMLKIDTEYVFCGKVNNQNGQLTMVSPEFTTVDKFIKLKPIYNCTNGLTSKQIHAFVKNAILMLPKEIKEPIPKFIIDKYDIKTLQFALQNIHNPKDETSLQEAQKRLIFEELLVLFLGLKILKNYRVEEKSIKIYKDFTKDYFNNLPFELTNAQLKVTNECVNDMAKSITPMNRLVQGDVGSGKTAVANALCYTVAKNGFQSAFMAPTEILATQHYNTLIKTLNNEDIKVAVLVGSLSKKQKDLIKEDLKNGEIDIIIGTHALLTENVEFKNLALVVTDEQHRFGVNQRNILISKGENPHVLVMSATPIPRTLGLIIYGDLDISVIDEKPKDRQEIDTLFINTKLRQRLYNFISENIEKGRQCYIVCPAVEENEMNIEYVESYTDKLKSSILKNCNIEILHGKMKAKDKENIMQNFTQGEIDILVSTTVIEVGVDVPNANIIVIENAERFGLSQLHQLRGRVGRGEYKSYCILISDSKNEDTINRIKILCNTNDGFKIANEDLKNRGPGDFFGSKQHGLPELKIADVTNSHDLALVQSATDDIIEHSPTLEATEYKGLRAEIKRMFGKNAKTGFN